MKKDLKGKRRRGKKANIAKTEAKSGRAGKKRPGR